MALHCIFVRITAPTLGTGTGTRSGMATDAMTRSATRLFMESGAKTETTGQTGIGTGAGTVTATGIEIGALRGCCKAHICMKLEAPLQESSLTA